MGEVAMTYIGAVAAVSTVMFLLLLAGTFLLDSSAAAASLPLDLCPNPYTSATLRYTLTALTRPAPTIAIRDLLLLASVPHGRTSIHL